MKGICYLPLSRSQRPPLPSPMPNMTGEDNIDGNIVLSDLCLYCISRDFSFLYHLKV